jgi:FkbM family methyltransferase
VLTQTNLVYDVGLYDGDDSAFYLSQGHSVLAIDASPDMIDAARRRFDREIRSNQLTLLNTAISDTTGPCSFWVCDDFSMWNSCHRDIASRDNSQHHRIEIPGERFENILAEYGVPHYLKVDIEGNDHLCLTSIGGPTSPPYISVEAECGGSEAALGENEYLQNLRLLAAAGYHRFKLIDQETLAPVRRGHTRSPEWWNQHRSLRGEVERRFKCSFPVGSTGPWGEDAAGPWMGFNEAVDVYCKWREAFFRIESRALYSFWCDWHASRL